MAETPYHLQIWECDILGDMLVLKVFVSGPNEDGILEF